MEWFLRVEVRESIDEAGESTEKLRAAVEEIRSALHELGWGTLSSDSNQIAELRYMNGCPIVIAHGASNHDNGTSHKLTNLLNLIGTTAPGSYGFAWHLDHDHSDHWVVHTLIRSTVTRQADPWFSPIIPTVEDPPDPPPP